MIKREKTGWNIAAGVLNIINAVLMLVYWPVAMSAALSDGFGGTNVTTGAVAFFQVINVIVLAVNLIALIVSHKHQISIVGHILGIIGDVFFMIGGWASFVNLVMSILAAVFVLLQHPNKKAKATLMNQSGQGPQAQN
ncbi:transporter [Schleiferilactobacillus harbinensis]|jgi:F0F1-type ATP synthase assembly protein I|uniref:Transporter n=1 Tax=Schleiferilactobacillus harbinensis TaxID=304207 RepID=A0ABU7T0E2_9LACO